MLKVTCPSCKKVFAAPDELAGRRVKCTACQAAIDVPAKEPVADADDSGLNLADLGKLEAGGQLVQKTVTKAKPLTMKEAQAQAKAAATTPQPSDPTIRICPKCGQRVKAVDLHAEVMCRHCGTGLPPRVEGAAERAKYQDSMADRMVNPLTFYSGFSSALIYPFPAMGSIALAMFIALASIAVPLLGVLGFMASANLNPITETKEGTNFGWVGIFISAAFVAQAIYFGSVAYYILIDTIRSTTSGSENPPNLTWNIINLGAALGGYVALVGLYILVAVLLVTIDRGFPGSLADFSALTKPVNMAVLALLSFGVPMNMIGLSSSHAMDGLNPVRVLKSIGGTFGHYIFLFLISLLYLGIYVGIMAAVLNWAGPKILNTAKEGLGAGFLNMLMGLLAWAVVMGMGFYFAYSIGRILGLFTRSYRAKIDFEL